MKPRTTDEKDALARDLGYDDAEDLREAYELLADRRDFADEWREES